MPPASRQSVTSPFGGRPGWADYFRNRHVIILPDNDDPGRKHALAVATASLSAAASIRIVDLFEAKVRGDDLHPALVSHLSKYRS